MEILNLIISLLSGAAGGNIAGSLMTEKNLGALANTIIGLIGGGAGDYILKAMGILASAASTAAPTGEPTLDLGSLLATIGASGVSGGALTGIIALIKDALAKK